MTAQTGELAGLTGSDPAPTSALKSVEFNDQYLGGVNLTQLASALTYLGSAAEHPAIMASDVADYVNRMTSAVLRHKEVFLAARGKRD